MWYRLNLRKSILSTTDEIWSVPMKVPNLVPIPMTSTWKNTNPNMFSVASVIKDSSSHLGNVEWKYVILVRCEKYVCIYSCWRLFAHLTCHYQFDSVWFNPNTLLCCLSLPLFLEFRWWWVYRRRYSMWKSEVCQHTRQLQMHVSRRSNLNIRGWIFLSCYSSGMWT